MESTLSDRKDLVRKQFAKEARSYAGTAKYRHAEKAQPMIELAKPVGGEAALDVATGWGFVSLAFAPLVRSIVGLDLTPEMIDLAKKLAGERSVTNVDYRVGDAEELPFDAGSFDLVTCRAAFDHLSSPGKCLREMKRVLKASGRIVLYEFVAPADTGKAALFNAIEGARDASHLRSLAVDDYRSLFRTCGLEEDGRIVNLLRREFEPWMAFTDAGEDVRRKVRSLLTDSITGDRAGLAPRVQGGRLSFTHTCVAWRLLPR